MINSMFTRLEIDHRQTPCKPLRMRHQAKRDHMYLEKDANLEHLNGKLIACLGYGSQGHAQAQNLRDSGLNVIVGNIDDPYAEKARKDGFEVVSISSAVKRSDIMLVLLPDEHQRQIYIEQIQPNLREGQVLDFASGYAIHFGLIRPPSFVDVVLCVPACLGEITRRRYVEEKGTYGTFGVHQDASGKAREIVMALSLGMGWLRFGCVESTFADEVAVNLFAETAGLSMIAPMMLMAYEVLVEAGFSAEKAFSETFYELQFIAEALTQGRVGDTSGSPTSVYLGLTQIPKIINEDMREKMRDMLRKVQSGELVRDWNLEQLAGMPHLTQLKRELAEHDIKHVESLFLERKKATGW